jgi:hypothetical protein
MTTPLRFNENTYFTKNIYVNTIDISSTRVLNINNMSITGDVSVNNVIVTNNNNLNALSSNNLININLPILYNKLYNTINSNTYINYTQNYTISSVENLTTSTTVPYSSTNITLPNGIYIFSYNYALTQTTANNNWVNNLEEHIYNTINSVSTLIIKNSIHCKLIMGANWGFPFNSNTWHVLTEPSNTLSLNFKVMNLTGTATLRIYNINFTVTRIA